MASPYFPAGKEKYLLFVSNIDFKSISATSPSHKLDDFRPTTTFTFGGTMADMPPLRDKDGNPNLEFFRAWQDKTIEFFRSNKK